VKPCYRNDLPSHRIDLPTQDLVYRTLSNLTRPESNFCQRAKLVPN
jgi:hypothetical protein